MIGTNHPDHPIPSTGLKNRCTSFLERPWSVLECGCGYKISIRPSWSVVECSGREWQMEWQIEWRSPTRPGLPSVRNGWPRKKDPVGKHTNRVLKKAGTRSPAVENF